MNGCEASLSFAFKCLMKERPLILLSVSLVVSVFLSGYLLRVFEKELDDVSGMNFDSFSNALWNVIVTMTTVGYGDFFPQTHVGRAVGIVICLWGVLVVSLFVVTLTNKLALSAQ